MNSSKLVTEYPVMSRGTLEWEIRNFGLHFEKCTSHWAGEYCSFYNKNLDEHLQTLKSASMKLAAGDGNQSKWHFDLVLNDTNLGIYLSFDGLFQADGSEMDEPLKFFYNTVVEKTVMGRTQTTNSSKDNKSGKKIAFSIHSIAFQELESIWPDGVLKITVKISHFSNSVSKVVDGLLLDSTDLVDSSPMPGCYGNLMNNPDLADFTIICKGSTFHAHKFILSVRSPVFRAMLQSGMSESTQSKLEIKDMRIETLKLMLEYIYKGTIVTFPKNLEVKIELLDSAEKYELKGLKSICMRKLFSNRPSEKDVGELAMAASIYGANAGAQKAIKDFCMKNHAKLMQNPEYKKLFLANPQIFIN